MQKGFLQRRIKLLEAALIEEEELRRAQIEESKVIENNEYLALAKHFAELESTAESHASLTKEAAANNKLANSVLHRCLVRLEELLVEMKNDLNKLPMTISHLPPVQERLNMNERYTVAHLLTASANLSETNNENETPEM